MINHHPNLAVLKKFVDSDLDASVLVIVASHIEMCPHCQQQVAQLTQQASLKAFTYDEQSDDADWLEDNFDFTDSDINLSMIDAITSMPDEPVHSLPKTVTEIEIDGQRLSLPRAMRSIGLKEWQAMGKVSRSRLDIDDDERKMSLLHIAKDGSVPCHTHKGFEITLLLQGSFEDEMGSYSQGDFIWLDGEHSHTPSSPEGCVCLTVSSDALQFTKGLSQILNPFGRFIY